MRNPVNSGVVLEWCPGPDEQLKPGIKKQENENRKKTRTK